MILCCAGHLVMGQWDGLGLDIVLDILLRPLYPGTSSGYQYINSKCIVQLRLLSGNKKSFHIHFNKFKFVRRQWVRLGKAPGEKSVFRSPPSPLKRIRSKKSSLSCNFNILYYIHVYIFIHYGPNPTPELIQLQDL